MIAISLALVSVGLFGAHTWDFCQDVRPAVVRVPSRRF